LLEGLGSMAYDNMMFGPELGAWAFTGKTPGQIQRGINTWDRFQHFRQRHMDEGAGAFWATLNGALNTAGDYVGVNALISGVGRQDLATGQLLNNTDGNAQAIVGGLGVVLTVTGGAYGLGKVRGGKPRPTAPNISNPVPDRLARVIPGDVNPTTLGRPGSVDVFVTAADDIAGMTPSQLAKRLTIPESSSFTIIEFPTPVEGLASPVFRTNPGFVGNGRTAGGAREFVIPNGPIPVGATTCKVGQ
jgi:hypothetical protein